MLARFIVDVALPAVALTWLFTEAQGPWDVFARLRAWAGVESEQPGFLAKLLACGGCTAFWAGSFIGCVHVVPLLVHWAYPEWLAWLVRCPLAAVAIVVILDMWKPYPPTDLNVFGAEEIDGGAEGEDET